MSAKRQSLINWAVLLLLAFTWGSSFILMKRGLEAYTAPQVAAMRMVIAFIVLAPLAVMKLKRAGGRKWMYILSVGLLGNFIPAFLFTKAQTGLSSSLTGMLNSLTPLFTLMLGIAFFRTRVSGTNVTGVLLGLAGAAGLIIANPSASVYGSFSFSVYVIIATVLYALSVNIIKKHLHDVNSLDIASIAFFMVGPPAALYLFTTDFTQRVQTPEGLYSLMFISILAVVGTALAVILFNVLIKRTSALFASSVTYMIPVFAVMWGLFDNETITVLQLAFIGVILAGVYLVNLRPKGNS